jgi:hypothetical protein
VSTTQELPLVVTLQSLGEIVEELQQRGRISASPHKRAIRVFLPSLDHRGATPPLIAEGKLFLKYVGDEEISVKAGHFACRHFRFSDEEAGMVGAHGAHPPYEVWVTADDQDMQTLYELTELQR